VFDCLDVAKASPAFNEGAAITYGTRAVDVSKNKNFTLNFSIIV
jgi:hypothetical protein